MQENIDLPNSCTKIEQLDEEDLNNIKSIDDIILAVEENEISPEFFHLSISDYEKLKYIKKLIPIAVKKIINHLESLPEYDCSKKYMISESIIGGITKNGNEVAIVARPSDDNKLLLKYTSEFDVLHYVDSELWYVHGDNIPRQLTFGHLLKETKINSLKYVGWAIIGGILGGVPAGIVAYVTGVNSIASIGAVVGAMSLLIKKNQ